ncbi:MULTISPECIES: hypothetical protein [Micromonospora]|uniref:DDE superfamily endonuclease n=1 Tax=Micromonospora vinacea TaxID=709878 RepID=A0ABS0K6C7_9ACTN|nr:hypothetical protein [Micromonospora vinacea]MBG6104026.1 hypothetical protein [Micromonospora vinacea]WSZ79711.1 hypothetical protein OH804_14915 [Micromonospora sp. NBC_00860]WTA70195.1 hypothetical protein OHB51_14020 [Micromonospora sp. NBC_00855]
MKLNRLRHRFDLVAAAIRGVITMLPALTPTQTVSRTQGTHRSA